MPVMGKEYFKKGLQFLEQMQDYFIFVKLFTYCCFEYEQCFTSNVVTLIGNVGSTYVLAFRQLNTRLTTEKYVYVIPISLFITNSVAAISRSLCTHTPIYDHPNIVVFSVQISYKILPQHFKVFILLLIIKDYAKRAEQFSSSGCFN